MLTFWTPEELSDFSRHLEDYHRVYGVFWTMSSIAFTDDAKYCPTAMVYLKSRPKIVINGPWWKTLNVRTQVFVIVHECLHAMLEHGLRNGKEEVPNATFAQVNQAQDITINEMIESLFKIPRTHIADWKKYCWISTCFPGDTSVLANQTFVYYLEKLAKQNKDPEVILMDQHGSEGEDDGDGDGDGEDAGLDELYDELTDDELEAMMNAIGSKKKDPKGVRGGNGGLAGYIERRNTKKKLSIKDLIKGMRTAASKLKPMDTFVTQGRRFASLSNDLMMPNAHDAKRSRDKFRIALCLDVSGSVAHLRPQFYELRELFLKEKDLLEVTSYVFANDIKEITSPNQSYDVGGGNAPFQLIEDELTKSNPKTHKVPRYPDCVIVITDGEANGVSPKHPKRWLWLLTEHNSTSSIPKDSRYYPMADVVFD